MDRLIHPIHFRRASSEDIGLIRELAKEIWMPAFAGFIEEPRLSILFEGMYNQTVLQQQLGDKEHEWYIIQSAGSEIGYLVLLGEADAMKLDKIYIHQKNRESGLGSKAMVFAEDRAQRLGKGKIWLRVNRKNEQAIAFYQKRGFVITAALDYPAGGGFVYDDFIMEKPIIKGSLM